MILLTGATGYLGSQIVRELRKRKMPFRVLVRDPSRVPLEPAASGFEVVRGDLCDAGSLGSAVRGVKYVIHTAALVRQWTRDSTEFVRVNVYGLMNLLRAASDAGVERVAYTSSFIALGPSAEASAREGLVNWGPYGTEYEKSKVRALEWLRAEGMAKYPVVVLLPGVIYGPGPKTEGNLMGGMIEQFLTGSFPGLLGSGEQRWSFAFIAEVAEAHVAALERGRVGEEYVLAGDNRSLNEFFSLLAELSGVKRRVRHLPFALGKMGGGIELLRARLSGRAPRITPSVVETFKHDWVYSSAKAARELRYHVTPLEDGLRKTLEARNG